MKYVALTIVERFVHAGAAFAARVGRLLVFAGARLLLWAVRRGIGAVNLSANWRSSWHVTSMEFRPFSHRRRLLVGWECRAKGCTSWCGRVCLVLCISTDGSTCQGDRWSCISGGETSEEGSDEGVGAGD